MTRAEYNDLYDSLCFGHDAELLINNQKIFFEWNENKIEIYHLINDDGEKIQVITGDEKINIVNRLFKSLIFTKCLNENFEEIDIIDIE